MQKRLPFLVPAFALMASVVAFAAHGETVTVAEAGVLMAKDAPARPMTTEDVIAFFAPEAASGADTDVLGQADLNAISGGSDIQAGILSTQELNATNSENVIGGSVYSGDVVFSDQALSGFAGVGNFVINTGAQNNLQGSITINILTTAP